MTDGLAVAADSGMSDGNTRLSYGVEKIRALEGRIFAFCGLAAMFDPWVDWWTRGRPADAAPTAAPGEGPDYLWVFEEGALYEVNSGAPFPLALGARNAMGSGKQYAYGALALGHSAAEALEAAKICDAYTFGESVVVTLPPELRLNPQSRIAPWPNMIRRNSRTQRPSRTVVSGKQGYDWKP